MALGDDPQLRSIRVAARIGERHPIRDRLKILAVLGSGLVVVAVGFLGPRGANRPASVGSAPSSPAAPVAPSPTAVPSVAPSFEPALPRLTVFGSSPPTGLVLMVAAGGQRLLDLSTGRLGPRLPDDRLLPLPDGGFLGAGIDQPWAEGSQTMTIALSRYDSAGQRTWSSDPLQLRGVQDDPERLDAALASMAFAPSGEFLALMSSERQEDGTWHVSIHLISAESGSIASTKVARIDGQGTLWVSPEIPAIDASGQLVGLHLHISLETATGEPGFEALSWLVPIRQGLPKRPLPLRDDPGGRIVGCDWTGFLADMYTELCYQEPSPGAPPDRIVRRFTPAGEQAGVTAISTATEGGLENRLRRQGHPRLESVRARDRPGRRERSPAAGDSAEITGSPATFGRPRSIVLGHASSGRVYTIGTARAETGKPQSSGVWVFDSETLELLDHWEPPGYLTAIALSADGKHLYAIGAPNLTPTGEPSLREAALFVFDTSNGHVLAVEGQLGVDYVHFPDSG